MNDYFDICSCGNYMEKGEQWCQSCHTLDSIEGDGSDEYLDELLLENTISNRGVDGIKGVSINRKSTLGELKSRF